MTLYKANTTRAKQFARFDRMVKTGDEQQTQYVIIVRTDGVVLQHSNQYDFSQPIENRVAFGDPFKVCKLKTPDEIANYLQHLATRGFTQSSGGDLHSLKLPHHGKNLAADNARTTRKQLIDARKELRKSIRAAAKAAQVGGEDVVKCKIVLNEAIKWLTYLENKRC